MNALKASIGIAVIMYLLVSLPAWAQTTLIGPQHNAVRSAQLYLSIQGFSRTGLIEQLSSEFGDGYSVSDATAAVDSLNVDWDQQAVKSARLYLSIMGFSCQGLIEQLLSSYGDSYTASQAAYGAKQVGACG
ncbi:Ltp family lipoprotein [Vreelandella sp. EE27]